MTLHYPSCDHSAATGFAGNELDRLSERRDDAAFMASLRAHTRARLMLYVNDRLLTRGGEALFDADAAHALGARLDGAETVFLGLDATGPIYAAVLDEPPTAPGHTLHNLRQLAIDDLLPADVLGAVAQGRSVTGWHLRHRYCANCGALTAAGGAGMRRDCPSCGAHHFPRTDPVVIMLAVDGERCLLGRQTRFVAGVYSCLAGFMEPGETIEAAVRREIWEEAGVTTSRVAYHASQPWPFPSSLMIGCFAEATSAVIDPRDAELEDVRWFDRGEILPMLEGRHPTHAAPPRVAIAHHLLRAYAREGAPIVDAAPPPWEAAAAIG